MAGPRYHKGMEDGKKLHGNPAFSEADLIGALSVVLMKEKMELEKSVADGIALLFAPESHCCGKGGPDCCGCGEK